MDGLLTQKHMSTDKNVVISGKNGEGKKTSFDEVVSGAHKFQQHNSNFT